MPSNLTDTDDLTLWSALRSSDEAAFATLYHRYVRVLYSYGLKVNPNTALVDDAVQDLFVDLWRMRYNLGDITADSVRFYLYRSLRRKIHRSLRPEETLVDESTDWVAGRADLPVETVIIEQEDDKHRNRQLQQWLANLSSRQYEALMLYYFQDYTYAQVAEVMQINEQSARNLVQKALHRLRELTALLLLLGSFSSLLQFFWAK
ncbi:RNA polymerase sigma factor [Fibrella aquatilis]|uniref:Sigma-70 family RNA polymerase sigma factor n=1 Tax=Fibrella aquatilis TaxID=2817059 RepID=A0A939G445_9BACT|nr:sigma-70 family RNA polymerase sigma factor [Fibrella aquatilis]MBO0932007.1 sigma-70 family RNA polymerase sigma factor [Fibrella aquatilis]